VRGRQFFHGTGDDEGVEDEDWLNTLREAVGGCVGADGPMGPLGLRYCEEGGLWEVWLYPTPVELVGGRHDGEVVVHDTAACLAVTWPYSPQPGTGSTEEERTTSGGAVADSHRPARPTTRPVSSSPAGRACGC
jgi:hypothetical protein